MKSPITIFTLAALLAACGCSSPTNVSSAGGIVPINEEFSITVPATGTIKQGGNATINVLLNRGPYFKQDVQLDIKTDGISVTPSAILVKASDQPTVPLQVNVGRDAAIGDYRVAVKGTPETGAPTSTVFIVNVVAQ
jgi:uncharacterized membrane protein